MHLQPALSAAYLLLGCAGPVGDAGEASPGTSSGPSAPPREPAGTSSAGRSTGSDDSASGSSSSTVAGSSSESGSSSGGTTQGQGPPPPGGEVLFALQPAVSGSQLFLATVGGDDEPVALTDEAFRADSAAWSSDGARIVFASNRGGSPDLWRIDAAGGGLTQITDDEENEAWPSWSPSGDALMFRRGSDVVVTDADGAGAVVVSSASGAIPGSWSPDGTRLSWSTVAPTSEVYVVGADGSGELNLTDHPARDARPAWSPDGSKIAFVSDRNGSPDIFVMDTDGSNVVALTETPNNDDEVAWSPDGTHLAFLREDPVTGTESIWVMQDSGDDPHAVSDAEQLTVGFSWSPDSWHIAYSAAIGGVTVVIVGRDGEDRFLLHAAKITEQQVRPRWRP